MINDNLMINSNNTIFFDDIIENLKKKINDNEKYNKNIHLYFKSLYNKEKKVYDELLIHCFYKKNNKNEFIFCILLNNNYKNTPPKIFCQFYDNDNTISIIDKRDLFNSIIEKNNININNNEINIFDLLLDIIITKIPEFIKKIVFYEESKIFMYFGKYYLNEIYNINDFISNKNLFFYKVMEYKKDIKDYIQLNIKYIIVSDFHVLFFDLFEDKPKNICKLIFIGEIYKINSFERLEENNNVINNNENKNNYSDKIYIDWILDDNKKTTVQFIFSVINDNNNNNKENIPDFIDIVNKKQSFIGIKYKLVIKDYNEYNNQYELNELIKLAKILEKKEKILGSNDMLQNEMNKIYQKIIDISTKFNKIGVTLEYLEKIKNK
jgi:hypothetical protein